jgi:hypothetical protein
MRIINEEAIQSTPKSVVITAAGLEIVVGCLRHSAQCPEPTDVRSQT